MNVYVLWNGTGDPVAVVRARHGEGIEDLKAIVDRHATDDMGWHYLNVFDETLPVLGSAEELKAYVIEHMTKLAEKYYDEHQQSAAQLAGESTL